MFADLKARLTCHTHDWSGDSMISYMSVQEDYVMYKFNASFNYTHIIYAFSVAYVQL